MSDNVAVTINEKTRIPLFATISLVGAICGALVWHLIFILGVSATANEAKAIAMEAKLAENQLSITQTAILVQLAEIKTELKVRNNHKQ